MRVPRPPKPRVPRGSVAEKRPSAKGSVAEPRPLPPRGDIDHDEHDVTSRRVLYEIPEIVDSDSDPGDSSIEMTAQRPMFDASDSVEMTAERSPILDQSGLEIATTDLDSTVIEVEADLPDDPRAALVTKPRFDRERERERDRERQHERDRDRPSYEQDDSEPEIQVGRPLPSRFHHDDAPEVTSPRAPAVGTNRKLARKQLESPPPTPVTGPGPGETFEHLETRALDEFMEPTRIQQPIHEMEDRPTTNLDPGERGLLAAIAEGSEPSRLKYADWLQRHGESARAEFLRVDCELAASNPNDPKFERLLERRHDLSSRISVDWRSRVSRAPIEGCSAFDRPCPGRWAALSSAEADDVRPCGICHKDVYYCATIQLAQGRVRNGDPVAIDVTCQRWPGDLGGTCVQCNAFVPSEARFCPHCGQSMQLVMMGTV